MKENITLEQVEISVTNILGESAKAVSQNRLSEISRTEILKDDLKNPNDVIVAVGKCLLARSPREYLRNLNAREFSQVLLQTVTSLHALGDSSDEIFVNQFHGQSETYLSVVLPDCPFIINTFNNICEKLYLESPVILHPIIRYLNRDCSVSVLIFPDTNAAIVNSFQTELVKYLPVLRRANQDFPEMLQSLNQLAKNFSEQGVDASQKDIGAFLGWLVAGRFTILGMLISDDPSGQGIFATEFEGNAQILAEIESDRKRLSSQSHFSLSKLSNFAPVHYRRRLLHFIFRDSVSGGLISVVGLWTSRAIAEEAATIPIIRMKLVALLELAKVAFNGHDHKAIIRLINATPKHHLLMASVEDLLIEMNAVHEVEFSQESDVLIKVDASERGINSVLVLHSRHYTSELTHLLKGEIEKKLGTVNAHSDVYITSLNDAVTRIYFYTPIGLEKLKIIKSGNSLSEMAGELARVSLGWMGRFERHLVEAKSRFDYNIYKKYGKAFSPRYQALTDPEEALLDVEMCETLSPDSPIRVRLDPGLSVGALSPGLVDQARHSISIVRWKEAFSLGQILPVLENFGLEVVDAETLEVCISGAESLNSGHVDIYLHRLFVRPRLVDLRLDATHFENVVAPALENILQDQFDNDSINSLMLTAGLDAQAVSALRIYHNYLWQVRRTNSRLAIRASLTNNPKVAGLLWKMFQNKFDPKLNLSIPERQNEHKQLWDSFHFDLKGIKDITEDATLKAFAQLLQYTVRTNFFQNAKHKAIKVHSELLPILRGARPMFETYVAGPQVEGIHLRSSRVSRGGLRWSDRKEDFRTEVLGLMRVQRIKNAIAVPSGAKGGFVVKEQSGQIVGRDDVVNAYREYIRALLSLADNMLGGKICTPKDLIIYDQEDPYLVVAADKGTASFSDYANQIACDEYNFWLSDGFASGGSKGYSHKELGITARGAWECAKHHFMELGVDFEQNPFTVVGIGDMSGDVFGNGLLLSKKMKLIGAFDHRHIFIDPNPQIDLAYAERQRLFALSKSSWMDYRTELISKGGGLFDRLDKEINLSLEARASLGVPDSEIGPFSGEQVISLILKAPVDLLWNGGIGTYVKGSLEVDSEVNDSANDAVRINGVDLRARVVAEGGNVGFTQAARVEFSMRGGRINTDSIDNSAGVDLSDHEVNLKILFQELNADGACSLGERDEILKSCANEVSDSVLAHNRNQSFVISVAEKASKKSLDYFRALLRELVERGYVTRNLDGLPSDDELEKRALRRLGLTRPEIAICLAGMKLWIKDEIMRADIPSLSDLQEFALEYFPQRIRKAYPKQILRHALIKNITATELTNHIVDLVGITFLHRLQLAEGINFGDALKATIAASLVLNSKEKLANYDALNNFSTRSVYIEARIDLGRAVRVVATQFVHRFGSKIDLSLCKQNYQGIIANLFLNAKKALPDGDLYKSFEKSQKAKIDSGISSDLSDELSLLHISWLIIDAADLARDYNLSIEESHRLLIQIWQVFDLDFMVLKSDVIVAKNKWEHELLMSSYDRLRSSIARIAAQLLKDKKIDSNKMTVEQVTKSIEEAQSFAVVDTTVAEFRTNTPEISVLYALARHLENFKF